MDSSAADSNSKSKSKTKGSGPRTTSTATAHGIAMHHVNSKGSIDSAESSSTLKHKINDHKILLDFDS